MPNFLRHCRAQRLLCVAPIRRPIHSGIERICDSFIFGERRTRIRRILCTELEAVELHLRLSCYLGSTSRKAEGSGLFTHVYAEDSNENSATMLVSWAGCAGLAELEDWPCAPRPQRSLLYILTLTSPSLPYSLTLCGRKVWIRPLSLRCGERLRTAA